jgi:predicted RNase H-like HicB family nuclease
VCRVKGIAHAATPPRTLIGARPLLPATSTGREIRLVEEDGRWSAIDGETGVASFGDTREEALEMLDEAVALHTGEAGDPVTDEDLRELGIDSEFVPRRAGVRFCGVAVVRTRFSGRSERCG